MSTLDIPRAVLTRPELRAMARDLRSKRELWQPLVHHTPDQRHYELLHHDESTMAWVISWMDAHDTGFHDHDLSAGAGGGGRGRICEGGVGVGVPPVSVVG